MNLHKRQLALYLLAWLALAILPALCVIFVGDWGGEGLASLLPAAGDLVKNILRF